MPVPQGRHSYVTIGGTAFPFYSWAMPNPRNLVVGQPLGSSWAVNHAEGLKTTRFVGRLMCRSKAAEVLALALWNHWLPRTFSGGFDDTTATTIVAGSGGRLFTLASAKAEAFVLSISSGAIVGMDIVFVAPGIPTIGSHVPADYSKTVDNSAPLMFDAVSFTGISNVYAAEVRFANNHLVDAPLNQTKLAVGWDAGSPMASAAFTIKEGGTVPADETNITIALTGAGPTTRTISLTKCSAQNPYDGNVPGLGQVYQRVEMLVEGNTTTPPLVVT